MNTTKTTEERIGEIIHSCKSIVSEETNKEVRHFYEHGEFEMAFEGLLIDLMKGNKVPQNYDYDQWCNLIKETGLDEETNFVGDLWENFQEWGKAMK